MTEIEEAVTRVGMSLVDSQIITAYGDGRLHAKNLISDLRAILSALSASQAEVERLTRERDEALREMGRYAAEAGEAKGRLEMSEAAGIVDMWREHAQAAEARATRAEGLLEEAGEVLGQAHGMLRDYVHAAGPADAHDTAILGKCRAFRDKLKEQGQ